MNNACPECGAIYAVAEKDIGRKIACKKCNAALVVTEEGLERAGPATPSSKRDDSAEKERDWNRDDDDRARKRDDEDRGGRRRRNRDDDDKEARPRKPRGPGAGEILNKLKGVADVATWLYGIGLFFTIYGYFSSQMDEGTVKSRRGALEYKSADFQAYVRSVTIRTDGKTPSADEMKKLGEKQKEWESSTYPELIDDVTFASASQKKAAWWNVVIQMFGFFLLAFGSVGFLKPEEPQLKRILGGGTILIILLQATGVASGYRTHQDSPFQQMTISPPVMEPKIGKQ